VVTAALTGAEFGCSTCAVQVSALETIVSKGGKVADADVVALTEALMNELVKLDSVAAEGEVKVQRRMQVSRSVKSVSAYVIARRLNFLDGFARAGREARESSMQRNAQPMVVLCRRSGCRSTWRRWTPSARRTRRRLPRPTAAWTWTATPRAGPRAAPPAARVAEAELPAAFPGAARAELGVVRPAVVGAVHVLGRRDHHLAGRRLLDPAVRLGALLKPIRCVTVDRSDDLRRYIACPWILSISFPLSLLLFFFFFHFLSLLFFFLFFFFHFLSICISTTKKEQRPTPVR
jgi:hypothetical protein